jgi:hypothetical protein
MTRPPLRTAALALAALGACLTVAPAQPPAAKKADPPAKSLTAIPLRELTPEKAVTDLEKYAQAGAVLTPVPGERTLLVYADDKTREEIGLALLRLGEVRRTPTVVRLHRQKAEEMAATLKTLLKDRTKPGEIAPLRFTITPVPAENVVLVYANEETTQRALRVLQEIDPGASSGAGAAEPTFSVEFRNAPWADVLEWYAKISGLTLISAIKPPGTCTIMPGKDRRFTLVEVTDLLNEVLIEHKMHLQRLAKSCFVWPHDERFCYWPQTTLAELAKWSKYERIQLGVPLKETFSAEKQAKEIKKLLGPGVTVVGVDQPNRLVLMGNAGHLQRIRGALQEIAEEAPKRP